MWCTVWCGWVYLTCLMRWCAMFNVVGLVNVLNIQSLCSSLSFHTCPWICVVVLNQHDAVPENMLIIGQCYHYTCRVVTSCCETMAFIKPVSTGKRDTLWVDTVLHFSYWWPINKGISVNNMTFTWCTCALSGVLMTSCKIREQPFCIYRGPEDCPWSKLFF